MKDKEMNVLVLNGERKNENTLNLVGEIVSRELTMNGWQAETILLWEKNIARCTGCFGCWVKTPGICVINDFGREVARLVVQSDLLILLAPVTFGGYSSELKKAMDRFACPILLPFFMKIGDEVHHKARYKSLPNLIGIGTLPRPDEESERIFTDVVNRNSINLHSRSSQSAVFYSSHDPEFIQQRVRSIFRKVKK